MGTGNLNNEGGRRFPLGTFFAMIAGGWLLAWVIGSCQAFPDTRQPQRSTAGVPAEQVVHGENVHFLDTPADRARTAVADAEDAMDAAGPEADEARADLARAKEALDEITGFYLPLTAARDALVRAWYDQAAGKTAARDDRLAEAGNALRQVVENGPPPAATTAGELLSILDSIELHKGSATQPAEPKFADDLRSLCTAVQDRLTAAEFDLDRPQDETAAPTAAASPATPPPDSAPAKVSTAPSAPQKGSQS